MDKETSQNMQDKFMYALQVLLLAFVAALVFSWEAAVEPKIVILLLSAVLIVQLPVVGRLARMVDSHFVDLTKSHGVTHILLIEMRKGFYPVIWAIDFANLGRRLARSSWTPDDLASEQR